LAEEPFRLWLSVRESERSRILAPVLLRLVLLQVAPSRLVLLQLAAPKVR
jgi:hypothetical protein